MGWDDWEENLVWSTALVVVLAACVAALWCVRRTLSGMCYLWWPAFVAVTLLFIASLGLFVAALVLFFIQYPDKYKT